MMKTRTLSALVAAVIIGTLVALPDFAAEPANVEKPVEAVDFITIMPPDMPVASGTIKDDSGLDLDKKLNRDNGKYVNFYVENLGNDPVKITINGQNSRTLEAGESGHIDMEVTQGLFGGDKTYTFKAVAGTNGGTVHINYTIYQRDERS